MGTDAKTHSLTLGGKWQNPGKEGKEGLEVPK